VLELSWSETKVPF